MSRLDELTVERWAVMADQALCESEAAHGRRLSRRQAARIIEHELERRTPARDVQPILERVTSLLLDERGYVSGLSGGRVRPVDDADVRPSFFRQLARRRAS